MVNRFLRRRSGPPGPLRGHPADTAMAAAAAAAVKRRQEVEAAIVASAKDVLFLENSLVFISFHRVKGLFKRYLTGFYFCFFSMFFVVFSKISK